MTIFVKNAKQDHADKKQTRNIKMLIKKLIKYFLRTFRIKYLKFIHRYIMKNVAFKTDFIVAL